MFVRLPDFPKEKEFEEYVSALFQSSGYYIERNITERSIEEVLELDIILTDYNLPFPDVNKLVEAKSGSWGFPDIFKIYGWMNYLNITNGMFVVNNKKDNFEFYKKKAEKLNIDLVAIPKLDKSKKVLSKYTNRKTIDDTDISMWQFSHWVEDSLLNRLTGKKKSIKDKKCFKALDKYNFEVNSRVFFTENIIQRLIELYAAFQEFPHISAKCGNENMGNPFDEEYDTLPESIFSDTYYKCNYNDIQISTFIEHRARLAILKNAVDYKLYKTAEDKNKTENMPNGRGLEVSLLESLPPKFKEGLDVISNDKYFCRYPVFWQWFMWLFGGFILKDYEEQEYELLFNKTGIPVEEIPKALGVYQKLFTQENGWFKDLSPISNIKVLKMFPVPFMGIGANYRRLLYTKSKDFKDLELTGKYTLKDLIKWNNLTAKVLRTNKRRDNIDDSKNYAYSDYSYSKGDVIKFIPSPSDNKSIAGDDK